MHLYVSCCRWYGVLLLSVTFFICSSPLYCLRQFSLKTQRNSYETQDTIPSVSTQTSCLISFTSLYSSVLHPSFTIYNYGLGSCCLSYIVHGNGERKMKGYGLSRAQIEEFPGCQRWRGQRRGEGPESGGGFARGGKKAGKLPSLHLLLGNTTSLWKHNTLWKHKRITEDQVMMEQTIVTINHSLLLFLSWTHPHTFSFYPPCPPLHQHPLL